MDAASKISGTSASAPPWLPALDLRLFCVAQCRVQGESSCNMTTARKRSVGWLLLAVGICITAFSHHLVFPVLEQLLGIETIVGKQNVVYLPEGGYAYTNPGAMVRWIVGVAVLGVVTGISGVWLLWKSRQP